MANLPVGEHLQDHLKSDMGLYSLPGPYSLAPEKINFYSERIKYALFGTGRFSNHFTSGHPITFILLLGRLPFYTIFDKYGYQMYSKHFDCIYVPTEI